VSERENFLARWSRRKLEIEEKSRASDPDSPRVEQMPGADAPARGKGAATPEAIPADTGAPKPEFDFLKHLPSIESITATTDIRAFLMPGVPPELTRAALRRAWSIDPNIRDYIGLAENQWDFASGDIPGFGPLELTEDLKRIVAEIVGDAPPPVTETPRHQDDSTAPAGEQVAANIPESPPNAGPSATAAATNVKVPQQKTEAAAVNEHIDVRSTKHAAAHQTSSPEGPSGSPQRGHGGALPR
jgi:hypothetical protein